LASNLLAAAIHFAAARPPINLHRATGSPPGVASQIVTAPETTDDFSERIAEAMDGASLALLLSIGHQTSLLDTMAGRAPATSAQIAEAAGLNERYVREWLAGVTTGHVVDYDASTGPYSLPAHRAGALNRGAGPHNRALVALFGPELCDRAHNVLC